MKNRLSFIEYGGLLALTSKARSEDPHTKVGACAMDYSNRIIATGYNGLSPNKKIPEWMFLEKNRHKKAELFIHAESNVCSLIKIGECRDLYITISPCIKCCQTIGAMQIKRVFYLEEYSKCSGFKDFFDFHNIEYNIISEDSRRNIQNFLKMELLNYK